jgi:drug/metabolite transporter (DMT)-like permease
VSAICFSFSQILNKLMSKHSIDNKNSMMGYFMLATATFAIFLLPFIPLTIPPLPVLGTLAAAVALFLIGYYLFFSGIFHADASSFAPLFQMQAGLVGLLAFLFLGERFPLQNYAWMVLIILGAILVSFNEKMTVKSFLNKGILLILLMQVFHATSNLLIGFVLKSMSPIQLLFWEDISVGIVFLCFYLLKKPKMNYAPKQIAPMFLSTYIVGVGIIALFQAFSQNLTVSSVIGLLSAPIVFVITIIASHFSPTFLEHHPPKVYLVRGIGLLIILLAAYKITLG